MTHFSPASLGRRLKSLEAGGFILTEAANLPLTTFPRHSHELASITFLISGSCIETFGSRPHECSPYSAIIKPAGEIHSNRYGNSGARCLIIEIKEERVKSSESCSQILARAAHLRGGVITPFAVRIYKEFEIGDSASQLSLEGLVLEVLGQAARRSVKSAACAPPRWLLRARELCHEQFAQPLSLSGISSAVGIHPAHLSRVFRRHYQCTVGEYVRRLRLDYAARELTRSDKSLVEIASDSGFYDQSHFTHSFKLYAGVTPTEYRAETKRCNFDTSRAGCPKTS